MLKNRIVLIFAVAVLLLQMITCSILLAVDCNKKPIESPNECSAHYTDDMFCVKKSAADCFGNGAKNIRGPEFAICGPEGTSQSNHCKSDEEKNCQQQWQCKKNAAGDACEVGTAVTPTAYYQTYKGVSESCVVGG